MKNLKLFEEYDKKLKVSFDFDDTLALPEVQDFVLEYMKDYDVHIVTARIRNLTKFYSKSYMDTYKPIVDNHLIYEVAKRLGIKHRNVHFTDMKPKSTFFIDNQDFIFHLDDDMNEHFYLNKKGYVKCVCVQFDGWQEEIFKIINK